MKKLLDFINSLPKDQRPAFFRGVGTTEGYLRKACSVGQCLSADLCMLIEEASSRAVMCEDMRPDCNWAYIRAGVGREAISDSIAQA